MRIEGRPRLGSAGDALARRARLPRGLGRRASHSTLGATSLAGPPARASLPADQEYPPRTRWPRAAVTSPRRARQPRGNARSPLRRPAEFRRRGERPAERLGDVQRRRNVRPEPRHDAGSAGDHPEDVDRGRTLDLSRQVLDGDQAGHHVRLPQTAHQAVAGAASADRGRGAEQGLRYTEARRRTRLYSDEPQPQSGLCVEPLGIGRGGGCQNRPQAEPAGLAHGARGIRRRYRRRSMEALGRRHDGPHDERVFPAAARAFRLQGLSQTHARGAGQRHHRGILRDAHLDRRLAVDRRREDRKDLSRGWRIRHAAGVRLRLQAQAGGVAELAAAVERGSDAAAEASQAGFGKGGVAGAICRVGKGAFRAVPTIANSSLQWWARRKSAFAHPTNWIASPRSETTKAMNTSEFLAAALCNPINETIA